MITINTIDNTRFSYNGNIFHKANYNIGNQFDKICILKPLKIDRYFIPFTILSEWNIDGIIYTDSHLIIEKLKDTILYTKDSLIEVNENLENLNNTINTNLNIDLNPINNTLININNTLDDIDNTLGDINNTLINNNL